MKNIHLLPTDKPSRLIFNSFHKSFCYQKEIDGMYINDGKVSGADFWGLQKALNNGFKPQNIYITSENEDINENDYVIAKDGRLLQVSYLLSKDIQNASKVVLTTDKDLIADGVQAIDDEFLEWFVQNPICECIETVFNNRGISGVEKILKTFGEYKIIIPEEETKQERIYSEEEVLEFTQTIIQQYKFGNTNIEQLDLLKETLQLFKNK